MAPHANLDVAANGAVNGSAQTARAPLFTVNSPNVEYTETEIKSTYAYHTTDVTRSAEGKLIATPKAATYHFKVDRKVGKVGLMLVGWGGNNGSTVTAGIIANRRKLSWETKEGPRAANYYGSLVMSSTIKLGTDSKTGEEINIPFNDMLPMVHPNDLVIGGWDISSMNLADSMDRAQVLEPTLKQLVRKEMAEMKPLPSVYYPDFIAANQEDRADNVLEGSKASWAHVEKIQADIRNFKAENGLDKVIVMWTANTERYADILPGVNDTAENLVNSIKSGHTEVSPSTVFAVACILDNTPFINGSPQNTFVPGAIELAEKHNAFIGGDDFKSGQTKMKSALVDFLINAGIKLTSIASYNHLVGDNKRALDEYYAEIFMGGHQTISLFNICEDSLLASPLIIDLVVLAEMMTRITWKADDAAEYKGFHSVLSVLSYMLKAPLDPSWYSGCQLLGKAAQRFDQHLPRLRWIAARV
ncbi:hypothetical protein AN7625.2 [Aspergillus nidulans FGSC A4]|nr:hypothetical protein AN7625.2 [Aspergillus nidulans FGSC A4]|eukprot:XP_680894.1 hypothetical protein AN7625.2 [Aspergillus nidulans FGSC A4]